jgi:hypothetical protein
VNIHQEIDVKAAPGRIYRALTDAKQFSALSGKPALTVVRSPLSVLVFGQWPMANGQRATDNGREERPHLESGWHSNYWEPLKKSLA